MASKEDFLNFPIKQYCTTTLSLGPPGSGKTYIALQCIKHWLANNVFDELHMIIPAFENEQNDSYSFLQPYLDTNVYVYGMYRDKIVLDLINKAKKQNMLYKAGKIKRKPRYFFMVDDATGQRELMNSPMLERIITENRHLQVHSWILLHQDKKVITPKIRENIQFIILYPLHVHKLKMVFEEYINFPLDFEKYTEFWDFWKEYVLQQEHGSMLIANRIGFNPNIRNWFKK